MLSYNLNSFKLKERLHEQNYHYMHMHYIKDNLFFSSQNLIHKPIKKNEKTSQFL